MVKMNPSGDGHLRLESLEVAENIVIDEMGDALAMLLTNQTVRTVENLSLSDYVPKFYVQAITGRFKEKWIEAMKCELNSHAENEMWEVVLKPENANNIKTLWVNMVKFNEDGTERAKARLVAFGCADRNNYDLSETYASVCRIEYIRLILSLSVIYKLKLISVDVTTAFLYGKINVDVYISVPLSLDIDRSKFAMKLKKSLYGLRISSKCWQNVLNSRLIEIGFVEMDVRCIYKLENNLGVAVLLTYIDDLLLACNSDRMFSEILVELDRSFKIKVNPWPKCFIGLKLNYRDDGSIGINQQRYIERLAWTFLLETGKIFATPMEKDLKLLKAEIPNDDKSFRAMIGGLLYCTRFSRPDIAFAVNKLSGHQGYVTSKILAYTRCVIRYLYVTRELFLHYECCKDNIPFRAFVDASHALDAMAKSVSGFILFHYSNSIDWGTRHQRMAAKSSTKAEITAVCDILDSIRVPCVLIEKLTGKIVNARVYEDNLSALRTLDGGMEKNLHWVVIRARYVQDAIDAGQIEMVSVVGKHQVADAMTKALDRGRFELLHSWVLESPKNG